MSHTSNISSAIDKYGFIPAGELVLPQDSDLPKFVLTENWVRKGARAKTQGLVYLWVKCDSSGIVDVAYVGKAGKTLKGRFSQHKGGFSGANGKTGENNATRITQWLSDPDHTIRLWARPSPTITVNDEQICMVSIDEESFIEKFRKMGCNLWNFQAR